MSEVRRRWSLYEPGLTLMLAGCVLLMGIITAESYYPFPYTTYGNEISDLGATRPPNSVSYQPSAWMFNTTMIVSGLMILIAAYAAIRARPKGVSSYVLLLFGVGVIGVGIFPGNNALAHPIFALMAFVFGGLSALLAFRLTSPPFKFVTGVLGTITLVGLVFNSYFTEQIGAGGAERWVAYPVIIWLIGYGGYLLGKGASLGQPSKIDSMVQSKT